jgi:hypothetical protein
VLAVVLSVVGGLCELAGLGLVVLGIARDRKQARELFVSKPRPERPSRSYPPKVSPQSPSLLTNPAYTASHNIRAIAELVTKVDAAAYNAYIEVKRALDEQLDEAVDDLRGEMADADDELRGHLRYVLAGSVDDRVKGAILLGVGIVLAAAGSVVGTAELAG